MTWFPMAFLPPQIALASGAGYSGAVLKAYAAETSTVIPMATGKTGVTTATSFVLNAAGYPTYSGNVIIPHVQANYKLCLYPNQAAADANSGAVWTVDDITIAPATNTAFVGEFSGDDSTTVFTLASNLGTDEKTIMVFADQKLEQYAPNTTFTDATALTLGAGWSSAGTLTAAGAISTDAYMTSLLNLVAGESYTATYTVTAFTAGTVTLKIGGVAGTARGATGTFTETIIPQGADQLIKFTGAGFTGSIDNLTVHRTAATHRQILRPEEYTVNGTSLTFNTAPAKGTNNILVFAPSLLFGAVGDLVAAAATSEANALTYSNNASASATTATTQAGIATTQATTATTQAGIATTQATTATTQATTATTQAGIATAKAVLTAADVVTTGTNATTATTQAGIATAKAVLTAADVVSTHADVVLTHADVVLTHADVVSTHADAATTATNATTSTTQAGVATAAAAAATAAAIGLANEWLYASSTTMANPSVGNFRLNNAALASATQIAISAQSGDSGNPNLLTFLQTWDDSNHSPRGIIRIEKNATNFVLLGVNGSLTDNTSWVQIPVTVIASAGSFTASDVTFIQFTPYGNDGTGTVNSVSVVSANGFAGTVATSTSTPAITVTTSVTGLLKGNGTAMSAATAGTDYAAATTGASFLKGDNAGGFSNQATIALTDLSNQAANTFVANGTNGAATPTAIALAASQLAGRGATGNVAAISLGAGLTMTGTTLSASSTGSGGTRALAGTDTVVASDNGKLLTVSGTCALALTAAATLGSFTCFVQNTATTGSNPITITPNGAENIDGDNATLVILPGEGRIVTCNGTSFSTKIYAPFIMAITSTTTPTMPKNGYKGVSGQVWGAGGSGGKGATSGGGGGGGGAYQTFTYVGNIAVGSTGIACTIGAGGPAQASANTAGSAGGFSSVAFSGAVISIAYGGGAGGGSSLGAGGGGGGAGFGFVNATFGTPTTSGVGGSAVTTTAGTGGKSFDQQTAAVAGAAPTSLNGGGGGGNSGATVGGSAYNGGAGGGASVATTGANGGASLNGGGGGGGAGSTTGGGGGYGGLGCGGGDGASAGGNGTSATYAGGGGGSITGTSGAGGNGLIIVRGIMS